MPLILGIDSSLTSTGLARVWVKEVWSDADPKFEWVIEVATVGNKKKQTGTRREYSRRITDVIESIDGSMDGVDLICMEELAYGAKGSTAFVLPWIWGRIIDCAEARDIPLVFANVSQVKKYGTGNGACSKDQVMAKMIRQYPEVDITNDNESDALVLACIGARGLGFPIDHPTVAKAEVMARIGDTTK